MSLNLSLVPSHGRWAFPAGSTTLEQFSLVTFNASGQLITATSGQFAVVLDDAAPLAGATFTSSTGRWSGGYTIAVPYGIVFQGVQKVITGANIAAGAPVMSDNSGHAITATGTGNVVLGWALSASIGGDIASILLDRSLKN